jgi:hypothetical protein
MTADSNFGHVIGDRRGTEHEELVVFADRAATLRRLARAFTALDETHSKQPAELENTAEGIGIDLAVIRCAGALLARAQREGVVIGHIVRDDVDATTYDIYVRDPRN